MKTQNQYFPQSRPHPGETLEEKLEEMGMGPKEFAIRVGKPEKTITAVLKGNSSITPDMAILFEKVTKIPASFWMNHQRAYDEYKARLKYEGAIEAAAEWARLFPLDSMVHLGWIIQRATWKEKADQLLAFFGFANHRAWEEYFIKQQLKIAFRISLAGTSHPYALSAWLRRGQLQATQLEAAAYNEKVFIAQLKRIQSLMAQQPDDFFQNLQTLCAEAGVKVVQTPCLPKAPIHGATRWLNDTPLIQLRDHSTLTEIFWFTFFHQAGHIILHGKKDIFLEGVDYSDQDPIREHAADTFAANWLRMEEKEPTKLDAAAPFAE